MPVAEPVRVTIRVHPGASRARVGGTLHNRDPEQVLGVWVSQRAVDGKANEAVLRALADALEVPRRSLRLVSGARARVKIVEVADPPAGLTECVAALRASS